MIPAPKSLPKGAVLRIAQAAALLLSLLVVISFLRHSLTTSATSFRLDFERQSFIELSRGETFLVARKLAALAKGAQINCVTATKRGTIFFQEVKGSCKSGFFRSVQVVEEPNQEISISFTIRLQDELFLGFLLFVFIQISLAAVTLLAQRRAIKMEHQRDIDLANLARQVGHDIRSPLAVLSSFHQKEAIIDEGIARRAIHRLEDLVTHLLGSAEKREASEALGRVVAEAAGEKSVEYGDRVSVRFFVDDALEKTPLPGSSFLWRRILSNLMNNSIEAAKDGRVVIEILAKSSAKGWSLELKDDGRGIPKDILNKVGTKGFSHGKGRISGLGLSSAREFVASLGGKLSIESTEGRGTAVRIQFENAPRRVVLIDDNELLVDVWKKVAQKRGIELLCFSNPEEFLKAAQSISRTTDIYLDLEFKADREGGLRLGEELKRMGFERIFLATGHPPEKFRHLPWVSAVVGKDPPWLG